MAIKIETINQFEGWGNDAPKSPYEHFYSKGFSKSSGGSVVGKYIYPWFTTSVFAGISSIGKLAKGLGRDYPSETVGDYLFAGDEGNGMIYQSDLGVLAFENIYRVLGQNWFASGMIVDQKTRLLYPGYRYLGMFDSSVANYTTGTVQVTNGSAAVVGTGTTFVAGDVGKIFRINGENGLTDFYRISAFTDATHITLASNYVGTSGSGKSYFIYRAWTDTWKDFGTEITSVKTPTEIYEDTVLFGRNNNILTLNTLTDTITTDSLPAFSMPSGYVCFDISANVNGILMAFNNQGRGTLVLWDNYSDRSIAPWIRLDDAIIGLQKYSSGWVVLTSKTLYFTNGYGLHTLSTDFLDSSVSLLAGGNNSNLLVLGDYLYFSVNGQQTTRHRGGLYRFNLKTHLVDFYGGFNSEQYDTSISCLHYSPDFGRLYVGAGGVGYLIENGTETTRTYSFITNEIGQGQNWKTAEALRVPVAVSKMYNGSSLTLSTLSFSITAKINTLDRPIAMVSQAKSNGTTTTLVVDETARAKAEVGDEVEFLNGNNKGSIRNITTITGGGTATATYTLDSALSNTTATSDVFNLSGFKVISTKTISGATTLPDLYFAIKNRYRAKKYMVKFVITNLSVPIEIKPFQFIYDDQGAMQ